MLKQAVQQVLPERFLNRCVDIVDRVSLGKIAHRPFDAESLRSLTTQELSRIFSDPEITAAWSEDHARISKVIGSGEINGGVNPGDRRAIYSLIMALKPANVLEIGTHIGMSTIYIATALKRLNEGGEITTVDIIDVNHPEDGSWKKCGMDKPPASIANELAVRDRVHFHTGPCQSFMETTNSKFDFIFLDGDHRAGAVYQELSLALNILGRDGVILLHDYYPEAKPLSANSLTLGGPYYALLRVHKENPALKAFPLGALPWPTNQGTNMTSLALVVSA
jgi:predicted O-methyltransferase YrrM